MRTGDRAIVVFEFCQRPEFLAVHDKLLFREGRTKGLGIVVALGYDKSRVGDGKKDDKEKEKGVGKEAGEEKKK